jgi:hypothetical protein
MLEHEKELVSPDRFVELLNEELQNAPFYEDGMRFINVHSGYDFVALTPLIIEKQASDKWVFDRVSDKYTIAY